MEKKVENYRLATFYLSSANAFSLVKDEMLSFGKELFNTYVLRKKSPFT